MKLPMPVVCECGFSTMDAKRAVEHAKLHQDNPDACDTCVYRRDCTIRGDLVTWCKAYARMD